MPDRPSSAVPRIFTAVLAGASLPMALPVPLWITAGRMLFGVEGHLVSIFALTAGPVLAVLMLAAAVKITAAAAARRPFGAPLKTSLLLLANYVLAGAFGFFVPDFGTPQAGSVFSALAGPEVLGYSAALANPFGIATLMVTVAVLVTALRARPEPAGRQQAARL
ncbi:hypothetical protein GCM10009636_04370 [Arthrobacter koreensis]|uniref:hypothetical protein n=1 Tax=Arthrobacter koreensis TaxID=199136 RepID=UPI001264DFAC|nr:hypothetical protein [Arthrobacter koreensis]